MPTFLSGLPVHVLVVHAVVVLIPLAALAAIVIAVVPGWRRRFGWPSVGLAALATAFIPIATSSGEGLERQLPRSAAISTHTQLGDQLLPFVGALFLILAALVAFDRRRNRPADRYSKHLAPSSGPGAAAGTLVSTPTRVRALSLVLAVLTAVLAVVATVQVVRIGDSGARAAWGSVQYAPQPRPEVAQGG